MGGGVSVGAAVGISVLVGRGVNVSDGMAEAVSVGIGVKVSAAGKLVDVSTGAGEVEAGACLVLQAARDRVKIISKISFLFFMA